MGEGDRILLVGMTFFGYHGVDAAERALGQRFVVDLTLYRDLKTAGLSDNLDDTSNYAAVHRLVRTIVTGPSCNLLEHLAERIASAVLAETSVRSVDVRVRKPWAPIKESVLDWVGVEITRERTNQ